MMQNQIPPTQPLSADELYQRAQQHFDHGEWHAAVTDLTALQAHGGMPPAAADMLIDAHLKLQLLGVERPSALAPPRQLRQWAPVLAAAGLFMIVALVLFTLRGGDEPPSVAEAPAPSGQASAAAAASASSAAAASAAPTATPADTGDVVVTADAELAVTAPETLSLLFSIVSPDGNEVANGTVNGDALALAPGTYTMRIDGDNPAETLFSVESDSLVELRLRQGYGGLVAEALTEADGARLPDPALNETTIAALIPTLTAFAPSGALDATPQASLEAYPSDELPIPEDTAPFEPLPQEQFPPVYPTDIPYLEPVYPTDVPYDPPVYPTDVPYTPPVYPTDVPQPTQAPEPTPTPAQPSATPLPTAVPAPTDIPLALINGPTIWTAAQNPVLIERDTLVAADATLRIEPGVEVWLLPGADLYVDGSLHAAGTAEAPVRFVGPQGAWASISGRPNSVVALEHTELRNAGQDGAAISSLSGYLTLRDVFLTESTGGIRSSGAALDMQAIRVVGNNTRDTPVLEIQMGQAPAKLLGNLFDGNKTAVGVPQVRIIAGSGSGALDIQNNSVVGSKEALVEIQTAAALGGTIRCNAFRGGSIGLHLRSSTPSAAGFGLVVDNNAFEQQSNYGVASTIPLQAGNNWWGDASGPPDRANNPQGRGVRAGANVGFMPPLLERTTCIPALP